MKWTIFLLIPLILGLVWWLYDHGYACYKNKSAAAFLGRSGPGSFGATFTACSGIFGRCLKPKEGGAFHFRLTADLSKGAVKGRIYRGRELLAELEEGHPQAVLHLEPRVRYKLELRFVRASGSCALHWNREDRR